MSRFLGLEKEYLLYQLRPQQEFQQLPLNQVTPHRACMISSQITRHSKVLVRFFSLNLVILLT